jgi:hypothetical protein
MILVSVYLVVTLRSNARLERIAASNLLMWSFLLEK